MATETRKPTAAIAPFGLRMQPELRERIEAAAETAGRSMNAEIIARLEASFSNTLIDLGNDPLVNADMLKFVNMLSDVVKAGHSGGKQLTIRLDDLESPDGK